MLSWLLSLPFAVVVVSIPANIRSYCAVAPQGTLSSSASYKQYQKHARRFLHTLEDVNSAIPLWFLHSAVPSFKTGCQIHHYILYQYLIVFYRLIAIEHWMFSSLPASCLFKKTSLLWRPEHQRHQCHNRKCLEPRCQCAVGWLVWLYLAIGCYML